MNDEKLLIQIATLEYLRFQMLTPLTRDDATARGLSITNNTIFEDEEEINSGDNGSWFINGGAQVFVDATSVTSAQLTDGSFWIRRTPLTETECITLTKAGLEDMSISIEEFVANLTTTMQ